MSNDGVGAGGAQVVGGKALEDFMVKRLAAVRANCNVSASVIPAPSRFEGLMWRSSAKALICAAAPWTRTTRMLSERKTATSSRMLAKFSSVTIPPSTLMTNIFSRNCGMY